MWIGLVRPYAVDRRWLASRCRRATPPLALALGADAAKLRPKYDKPPMSLRQIAEETSLGLNTVRTIIAQAKRTDRTSRKHLARVEPQAIDRQRLASRKRQRRSGNELPKRINNHLKAGAALIREAKGVGRAT